MPGLARLKAHLSLPGTSEPGIARQETQLSSRVVSGGTGQPSPQPSLLTSDGCCMTNICVFIFYDVEKKKTFVVRRKKKSLLRFLSLKEKKLKKKYS